MSAERPEFSLYIMWPESTHPLLRFEPLHLVMLKAREVIGMLTATPMMRQPEAVIITDGGDDTVFRWEPEKGLVFPTPAAAAT